MKNPIKRAALASAMMIGIILFITTSFRIIEVTGDMITTPTEALAKEKNGTPIVSDSPDEFMLIRDHLYYDPTTEIVYMRNYTHGFNKSVYIPYPASNGLPYKYDPEKGEMYMIGLDSEAGELKDGNAL